MAAGGVLVLLEKRPLAGCVLSFLFPAAVLLPLFVLRLLGAGDIKLLMVLGLFMGFPAVWQCILRTFLAGGVISLVLLSDTHDRKACIHMTVPALAAVLLWCLGA